MERHIQTVVSVIITALMLWVGASVTNLREAVARQDERLITLQGIIGEMQSMRHDLARYDTRITTLELERRQ